jgi:hypothetical protein
MRKSVYIPLAITVLGLVGFWLLFQCYWDSEPERLSVLGDYIGGAGSLLAIIWLTATLLQNTEQLRLQSQAMKEQQREAAHAARHAALATIASTLETFDRSMLNTTDLTLRCVPDIYTKFVDSMDNDWIKVLEESDRNRIVDPFTRWLKVESATLKFLDLVATCGRFYAVAVPSSGIIENSDDALYIAENIKALSRVPPLVPYIGTASQLAILLRENRPVLARIRERGAEALVGKPVASAQGEFEAVAKERAARFASFLKP